MLPNTTRVHAHNTGRRRMPTVYKSNHYTQSGMQRRKRRTPRGPVHPPDTALRADASFDSTLRYPGLGVTACAAAAGVDVCAGACAHVRGSAVLGGVDTEPGWLQEKYANTHYQIFLRVATMTGMPVDFVCNYWEQHTYLTAQRLIDHIRDEKYRLLTNTPRKEQGPISKHYASFLKNTDIAIKSLFDYTDKDLQDLEFDWLSQQTGFTVKYIEQILRNNEQANEAGMSNLAKLRTKKQQILIRKGLTSTNAFTLASSGISIEDTMQRSQDTSGVQCICPYPPSPWGVVAPASAEPGVFACVQACTCPPAGHEHCAATCGMGTETAQTDFDVKIEDDESLIGASGLTFKQMFARENSFYQGLDELLDSTDISVINNVKTPTGKTTTQGLEKEKTFRSQLHSLFEFIPIAPIVQLRSININTVKEFLAIKDWDHFKEKISGSARTEFKSMSTNFKEQFAAFVSIDKYNYYTMRLNVEPETRRVQLEQYDAAEWHVLFTNITKVQIDDSTHEILFIGEFQNNDITYSLKVFLHEKTFNKVERNLTNIVEISKIALSNTSAGTHATQSNTRAGDAYTYASDKSLKYAFERQNQAQGRHGGGCTRKS